MKTIILLLTNILLCFSQSNKALQWIERDRLLFFNKITVPTNPYLDSIEVHNKSFLEYAKPIIDSGGCVLPAEKEPQLYIVLENNDSLSISDYIKSVAMFSGGLQVVLKIQIAWTGEIKKIELTRYRGGKYSISKLKEIAQRIKSTPHRLFGFPKESIVSLILRKPIIQKAG